MAAPNPQSATFDALWDLDGELELLGAAYLELGQPGEAERYLSERLELAEIGHRRWPYHPGWGGNLAEARAEPLRRFLRFELSRTADRLKVAWERQLQSGEDDPEPRPGQAP